MQQDNNNMENKLRQLENQQLADLSQMDKHWENMQGVLFAKANTSLSKRAKGKLLVLTTSIIALIVIFFLLNNKENSSALGKTGSNLFLKMDPLPAESPLPLAHAPVSFNKAISFVNVETNAKQNDDQQNLVNSNTGTSSDPSPLPVPKKDIEVNDKKLLNNFYSEIQKPLQEFIIYGERGGIIIGKEGTKLTVPAYAFVDENDNIVKGPIKISVVEYYKYSDMLAANLTTLSNGKQLITGGMIKVTASQNGKAVNIKVDKQLELQMPTKEYDKEMQLFTSTQGIEMGGSDAAVAGSFRNAAINWQLSGTQSSIPVFDGKTKFLNLGDNPYSVIEDKNKRVAKFAMPRKSHLSTDEVKKMLVQKYGSRYDEIIVRKFRWTNKLTTFDDRPAIGDSVRLTVNEAIEWKYIDRKDSAFYAGRVKRDSLMFLKKALALRTGLFKTRGQSKDIDNADSIEKYYNEYLRTQQAYSFSIKKMGWMNCNKFYENENKVDFIVNLPADVKSEHFVTQLVFTGVRSVMAGNNYQNKIGFLNVPQNMEVYIVGLGERNGKVVSFVEKYTTGKKEVDITNLEETTPEAFKRKLAELDL
jgi:hypothetical protein